MSCATNLKYIFQIYLNDGTLNKNINEYVVMIVYLIAFIIDVLIAVISLYF